MIFFKFLRSISFNRKVTICIFLILVIACNLLNKVSATNKSTVESYIWMSTQSLVYLLDNANCAVEPIYLTKSDIHPKLEKQTIKHATIILGNRRIHVVYLSLIVFMITLLYLILLKQKNAMNRRSKVHEIEMNKKQFMIDSFKRKLTEKDYSLLKMDSLLRSLKKTILTLVEKRNDAEKKELKRLLMNIELEDKRNALWQNFESSFSDLNHGFIEKLTLRYPDLSSSEIKLCVMLRMHLSTKEIANLTNRSCRTIECMRFNIRKKMKLEVQSNLTNALFHI